MSIAGPTPTSYRIDDLVLEPGTRRVLRDDHTIDLPKLSFDLLMALADTAPNVVEVDKLIKAVWGDVIVSDETLTQRVKMLRDALDVSGDKQHYIETVRGVGYRMRQSVISIDTASAALQTPVTSTAAAGRRWIFAAIAVATIGLILYLYRDAPDIPDAASGTVAVLPFVALSDGPDDGYFADGLTEEILNSLAQLPELSVTARTSSFYFKGKDLPVPEIARTLGVAHVVEGSIRRDVGKLRITAQLIHAEDGFHLWSETFDRTLEDVFTVQSDIAERIADALDVVLDEERRQQMRTYGLADPAAYVAYQKGLEAFEAAHATAEIRPGLEVANRYFEEVMTLEPEFPDAYLMHADYYFHVLITLASGFNPPDITEEIESTAASVMLADLGAGIRYARSARQRFNAEFDRALFAGNWQGISSRLRRAIAEPGCMTANWIDIIALPYGEANASRTSLVSKVECDPFEFGGHLHLVRMHAWLGEFDALLSAAQAGMDATGNPAFAAMPVLAYVAKAQPADAERVIERELSDELNRIRGRIYLAAIRNDTEAGSDLAQRFNQQQGWTSPAELIQFHAVLGDRASANRVAAAADDKPFGHMVLAQAVLTCFCGAPFDLDATPNFAEIVAESSLDWPPTTPIQWPLKTW